MVWISPSQCRARNLWNGRCFRDTTQFRTEYYEGGPAGPHTSEVYNLGYCASHARQSDLWNNRWGWDVRNPTAYGYRASLRRKSAKDVAA